MHVFDEGHHHMDIPSSYHETTTSEMKSKRYRAGVGKEIRHQMPPSLGKVSQKDDAAEMERTPMLAMGPWS